MISLDSTSIIEPRNGGCVPRIFCEEVQIDRITSSNIASFPQCVEVHRCGGCCQGAQFSCLPVEEVPVTFSPVSKKNMYGCFDMKFILVIKCLLGWFKTS